VNGVDLRNVTVEHDTNSNVLVLKNVTGFDILQSKGIEDLKLDVVKEKTIK
jgi:hypothetical protein